MAASRRPRPIRVGRNAPVRGTRSEPKPAERGTSAEIRRYVAKKATNFGNRILPGNPF